VSGFVGIYCQETGRYSEFTMALAQLELPPGWEIRTIRRSVATRLWQQGNSQLAGAGTRPRAPPIATRSGLRSHAGSAGCGRRSLGGTAAGG
jgi:hypothetical protein